VLAGRTFSSRAAMPSVPGPVALAVAGAVLVTGAAVALACRTRARPFLARLGLGFAVVRSPRAFVTGVLSWKAVAWTLRLGSVYAFLLAFHVPAAPWTALVVVAAQNVAGSVPLLPGNAGTQQAAIGVALAGTASAAALLGFGVGMQASTAAADLVLGAVAVGFVATREDLHGALATLRPGRRSRSVAPA
jgi:uncharacterized membrane protein YbhN (UPF0104 family)